MEIELTKSLKMIRRRWWWLALGVIGVPILLVLLTGPAYTPIYQSSAELMVGSSGNAQQSPDIGTINYLMKTQANLDKINQWYPDLHLTADQLQNELSITQVNNSELMRIAAQDTSYDRSVQVINGLIQVSQSEIPKIFPGIKFTIITPAVIQANPTPINPPTGISKKKILLGAAVGLVLSIGIILVLDFADDTLKTEEEIRSIFGKPTLALVQIIGEKEMRGAPKQEATNLKVGDPPYAASQS